MFDGSSMRLPRSHRGSTLPALFQESTILPPCLRGKPHHASQFLQLHHGCLIFVHVVQHLGFQFPKKRDPFFFLTLDSLGCVGDSQSRFCWGNIPKLPSKIPSRWWCFWIWLLNCPCINSQSLGENVVFFLVDDFLCGSVHTAIAPLFVYYYHCVPFMKYVLRMGSPGFFEFVVCNVWVMFCWKTLLGTDISRPKAVGKMSFLSHWWDMDPFPGTFCFFFGFERLGQPGQVGTTRDLWGKAFWRWIVSGKMVLSNMQPKHVTV